MAIAGNLSVALSLNSARYRQGLDQARRRTDQFQRRTDGTLGRLRNSFRGVTGAVAGFAAALGLQQLLSTVDNLVKLSDAVGGNFEQFQRLEFALRQTGVGSQQTARALTTLSGFVVDLSDGTQTAVRTFDRLGLSLSDLEGRDPTEQFNLVLEALRGITDVSTRAAVAADLFGNRLALSLGPALVSTQAQLDEVGNSIAPIAEVDARNIEVFNDAMSRLGRQALALATQFSPVLTGISSFLGVVVQVTQAIPGLTQIIGAGLIAVVGVRLGQAFSGAAAFIITAQVRVLAFARASGVAAASAAANNAMVNLLTAGYGRLGPVITVAQTAMVGFGVVTRVGSLALRGFGAALRFALGPVGLVIIAVETLVSILQVGFANTLRRAANLVLRLVNVLVSLGNLIPGLDFEPFELFEIMLDEVADAADGVTTAIGALMIAAEDDPLEVATAGASMFREQLQAILDTTNPVQAASRMLAGQIDVLDEALRRGSISLDTYATTVSALQASFQDVVNMNDVNFTAPIEELNESFRSVGETIQTSLRDNLVDAFRTGSFSARSFLDDITGSILTTAANSITNSIIGSVFGGGGGGGLFGSLGPILGFNQGGIVPNTPNSRPGVDSVPALLTPGEVVTPVGEVPGGITVNFNVTGDVTRQTLQVIESNALMISGIVEQQLQDRGAFA